MQRARLLWMTGSWGFASQQDALVSLHGLGGAGPEWLRVAGWMGFLFRANAPPFP